MSHPPIAPDTTEPPEDIDGRLKRLDPDRWLSSRLVADPAARADVLAIYAYDYELARAPRVASNSLLGEIRLTWWREALDEIFEQRAVRMHPTAQALAQAVRAHDLPRAPLEAMIDARYRELDATPMTAAEALEWARETAGAAAGLAARILDAATDTEAAAAAGAAWALAWRAAGDGGAREAFQGAMTSARGSVRRLSIAAFPSAAHAVLAPGRAAGRPGAPWAQRLRIVLAAATGRI